MGAASHALFAAPVPDFGTVEPIIRLLIQQIHDIMLRDLPDKASCQATESLVFATCRSSPSGSILSIEAAPRRYDLRLEYLELDLRSDLLRAAAHDHEVFLVEVYRRSVAVVAFDIADAAHVHFDQM
ncbi:hypothetical protein ACN6KF_006702 [Labrys sp. La1]|uniref:hypothetical protein n=1 Tax=Labrys sp. La1 TaxID=3404917 RepID=UPI003EBAFAE8